MSVAVFNFAVSFREVGIDDGVDAENAGRALLSNPQRRGITSFVAQLGPSPFQFDGITRRQTSRTNAAG